MLPQLHFAHPAIPLPQVCQAEKEGASIYSVVLLCRCEYKVLQSAPKTWHTPARLKKKLISARFQSATIRFKTTSALKTARVTPLFYDTQCDMKIIKNNMLGRNKYV